MIQPRPDAWAHLRCWLSLQFAAGQTGPLRARLGDLVLPAHNHEELAFRFEAVFVRQEYLIVQPKADPVIMDCGANIGFATLYLKQHYPAARITCCEPNPGCCALLQRHIAENHLTHVTAHQVACGRENGEIPFFILPGFSPLSSMDLPVSDILRCLPGRDNLRPPPAWFGGLVGPRGPARARSVAAGIPRRWERELGLAFIPRLASFTVPRR